MRRQSIFVILVLLLNLLIFTGCGSSDQAAAPKQAAEIVELADTAAVGTGESAEDVIGVFEGLEDNHTAIFSFDGAEKAFYFDKPEVQNILWEAALGSSYTLSYRYEETEFYHGLVIYEISE